MRPIWKPSDGVGLVTWQQSNKPFSCRLAVGKVVAHLDVTTKPDKRYSDSWNFKWHVQFWPSPRSDNSWTALGCARSPDEAKRVAMETAQAFFRATENS